MTLTPRHIERSPEQQAWDIFIKTIKTLDEGSTPRGQSDIKIWSVGNGADTLWLNEFRGKPESIKLRNRVHLGNDVDIPKSHHNVIQDTTMTLFFSPIDGSVEEIRMNTEVGTVSFDNGKPRGPERKSFHFKLHMRQDFSLDGKPKICAVPRSDKGSIELYIEAQMYEGGNNSDTLNSFSHYNIQYGRLIPLSGAIADLTRNRVDLVHKIMGTKAIDQSGQMVPNTPLMESGDLMSGNELMTESEKTKPAYTIRVHEEILEVLFDGNFIGELRVLPSLNPAEHVSKFLSSCQDAPKGIKD